MDGIEQRARGLGNVIRIQIQTEAGRQVARRYDVSFTPTFIVFDRDGVERFRTFRPDEAGEHLRSLFEPTR